MEKHGIIITITIVLCSIIAYQALERAESIENDASWEVIQKGKQFLDERGYTTGMILFSRLEEKEPNFY